MKSLVDQLVADGYLKTPEIIEAFRRVPREDFVPGAIREEAPSNQPLPIGYGQTISQPLTVAIMIELLQPKSGESVLDIGAGSGWTAALLATIVGPKGTVVAVERIPQLCRQAEENLTKYDFPHLELVEGDGLAVAKERPSFDCIHVAAGAVAVPPILKERLRVGGRLVVPVGSHVHTMVMLRREDASAFSEQRLPGFAFVPLIESARA